MLVQLKQITLQLSDALNLPEGTRVGVNVESGEDGEEILSWLIVDVSEDGTITPHKETYKTLKELFECVYKKCE